MTTNREKLLAKVKALLSKTTQAGCTEAEAMSALNMAQAMMDAYEITEDELSDLKKEEAIVAETNTFDPHNIRRNLAVWVSRFADTKVWRDGGRTSHKLKFCGTQADVEFATWLLDSLSEFVSHQLSWWLMIHQPKEDRKFHIASFVSGCTHRINERLGELVNARSPKTDNSRALVVIKYDLIKKKMNELGINLSKSRNRGKVVDMKAYEAGKRAGDGASFGRPVSQGGTLRIGKGIGKWRSTGRKPVVIEAWQNLEGAIPPNWLQGHGTGNAGSSILIVTLEGIMRADPGDWIIRGVKGELYPCKPNIFAATYEPV